MPSENSVWGFEAVLGHEDKLGVVSCRSQQKDLNGEEGAENNQHILDTEYVH